MGIRKRGSVWWIDFTTPSGERVRRSAETGDKAQAQELHDKLKSEAWRVLRLQDRPQRSWNDAVVRWLKETSHKATHEHDKAKLRWLDPHLSGKPLDSINRALIDHITQAKLQSGSANATVNRMLALVRAILRRCERDWEWIDKSPAVRLLKEPTKRIRYLTREEADRLLTELPGHLADMATMALATGLRAANITGMRWEQVDLERRMAWVHPDQAKARRAIPVPLNSEAVALLQKQLGKHKEKVFTFRGEPVAATTTKAWYSAVKRAGLAPLRFHDLRHTFASWHVQQGTPLSVLQELGGWQSSAMVSRYAHLGAEHLAPWNDRLAARSTSRGTNSSQPPAAAPQPKPQGAGKPLI
jgi:integrase